MAGFGAFGKMPSAGDFFRLNTPGGFVRVWDAWLQQVMLDGKAVYGAGFDAHYMTAPIWRFTLPAGLAGAASVWGVMMPSVDRVGRRFPLTLMEALPKSGPPALGHLSAEPLFEGLEDLALDALEDTMTKDSLAERLAAMPVPDGVQPAATDVVMAGPLGPERLKQSDPRLAGCSLWTAVLDGEPRTLACRGLPAGVTALALFDLGAPVWAGVEAA
ncbi:MULTISPECIES: type VI secretion system-associated protein TagF [unclassified Leisingera]|uniref:type VI secretion system-associated protein TagF n=1 Tax=unclassified Leisingera TaxID=2614906 RepID=UPI00057D1E97|nr:MULTISPECIES: type VI secretion system-associated protein TagF [unclassified Leisingera]KIC15965.1 type VI secretion protein [Leisingera sp. ANG-DT]KIC24010.1 type VI secretion protein [Leisingera sp. ANG-M6]KIC32436.1 type VI secretion protein [Leisingera sp. ANG-S5]